MEVVYVKDRHTACTFPTSLNSLENSHLNRLSGAVPINLLQFRDNS
ncbi:hypothetical protein T4D_12773 [Trichinella pseudospiralis]|uniref:Uncharacterized protein n=1 Tax=Trichinella pseudospiralis TaxID=6337 RepID=A0A0V1EP85_TRIPS|nr:hypothetical protein T4D_12773 [Trichinella pseudospiralis]